MEIAEGGVTAPLGFRAGVAECGIKRSGRPDLAVIVSDIPASCAGMFTTNRIKAAPVLVSKEHVRSGTARAIIANSGNANACTGEKGIEDAVAMAGETARLLKCSPHDILVASTGVIGRHMPMEKILPSISRAVKGLSRDGSEDVARAIMTTDTKLKEAAMAVDIAGTRVMLGGVAKGSGMICPSMATMLCFLTTDADIEPPALRRALRKAVSTSFNCITIDGDMSTNDMVLILANGRAGNPTIRTRSKAFDVFSEALDELCLDLSKKIVRDGEGATKFITVTVKGALLEDDALKVGMAVANSQLVKTAFFGEDPNWGRIVCAAGYSGVPIEETNLSVCINGISVFEDGTARNVDADNLRRSMSQSDITIVIDLNMGTEETRIFTSDLSYEYVKINAEYTT